MRSIPRNLRLLGVFVCLVGVSLAPSTRSVAAAVDDYDGALWRFGMTNKKNPDKHVKGAFRLLNHVLFQKDRPTDARAEKRVGENHPDGKKTVFNVHDLRVFSPGSKTPVLMSGVGRMRMDKVGQWEGIFTDSDGQNWEFKASRVEELRK